MAVRPTEEYYIGKWNGNDPLSWAVFLRGLRAPVVSGLSRAEAESHKRALKQMAAERAAGRRPTL